MPTFAEVSEGVRAAIAAYAQALDDGRADDIVATFCSDGVVDIPGIGQLEGHDAIRAGFAAWSPPAPQRHLVVNTLITEWSDHEATAISDLVFMLQGEAGWAIAMVGRYHDTFHCDDGTWRFHSRALELS